MKVLSFIHQKGGTGKSTLSIATAQTLAAGGSRVLLMDADYQGTASEWGNRYGSRFQVETRSQVQPILHEEKARFSRTCDWMVIDGPPSLSPMTESILKASDRVIIPLRPSLPDVWALTWLAAIITKLGREGHSPRVSVVVNMSQGEDLAPIRTELAKWGLHLDPEPLPAHPGFRDLFLGNPLPPDLAERMTALLEEQD